MNFRTTLYCWPLFLLGFTEAAAGPENQLKTDLASGERSRILSAITKVQEGRITDLYPDVVAAFSANTDPVIRRQAIFLLSRAGAPQVPEMVREAVDDPKEAGIGTRHLGARELALQMVLRTDDRDLIRKTIRNAIADEDIYYRKYGAAALAGFSEGHDEMAEDLKRLADDPSPVVRFSLLGKMNMSSTARPLVIRILTESMEPGDLIAAAFAISRDGDWPTNYGDAYRVISRSLQEKIGHGNETIAAAAAAARSFLMKRQGAADHSFRTFDPANSRATVMTAAQFREKGVEFAPELLRAVLEHGRENDQLRAVALLSEKASAGSVPLLEFAALREKFPAVRKAAVFGLRAAGWVADFTEMGTKPNGRPVSTLVLKEDLTEAEKLRKAAALESLDRLVKQGNPVVSRFAREAIAKITGQTKFDGASGAGLIDHEEWIGEANLRAPRKLNRVAGKQIRSGDVLEVGNQKQLFIDDFVIDSRHGVERRVHAFEKHPSNPVFHAEAPWEENWVDNFMCSVHYDEAERHFKMWYRCGANHTLGAYAVSEDGISWMRPNLRRVDYRGSTNNNLLGWKRELYRDAHQPGHNISVLPGNSPDRRFLSFFDYSGEKRGFYVSYSPDGLTWSKPEHAQMVYGDVATLIPDPETGGFLFFPKQARWVDGYRRSFGFARLKDEKSYAPKSYPFTALTKKHDALVGREAARSFGILARGTLNPSDGAYYSNWHTQIYSVTPMIYEGLVLGFYDLWYLTGKKEGPLEMLLMATRDRKEWFDVGYPKARLPRGRAGEWDAGMVYGGSNILVIDDEIRFYYSGFNLGHYTGVPWGSQPHQIMGVGLATLRLDGFVSMRSEKGKTGSIVTKPLKYGGGQLELNADAEGGSIRVEVWSEAGEPLAGFSESHCQPVRSDEIRAAVSWENGDLADLVGKTIKLRFVLEGADLYAFQFRDNEN